MDQIPPADLDDDLLSSPLPAAWMDALTGAMLPGASRLPAGYYDATQPPRLASRAWGWRKPAYPRAVARKDRPRLLLGVSGWLLPAWPIR